MEPVIGLALPTLQENLFLRQSFGRQEELVFDTGEGRHQSHIEAAEHAVLYPGKCVYAVGREIMQVLVLDIWRETGKMVFFITHSVDEAIFMATRLIVMSPRPGRIIHTYDLDFYQRFFKTRDARRVKSQTEFIDVRQEVLDIIHGDEIRIDQG